MKQLSAGLCALAILLCISSLRPVQAQTTSGATRAVEPARYNPSEEVTITGVVSSVLTHAAPGMVVGSHLLLVTPAGPVDASLGGSACAATERSPQPRVGKLRPSASYGQLRISRCFWPAP